MKSGKYIVKFAVDLDNCEDESDAIEAMKTMFEETIGRDEFPEVEFELVTGADLEYIIEDEEVPEVNFEELSL
jgi:hypothetical protein